MCIYIIYTGLTCRAWSKIGHHLSFIALHSLFSTVRQPIPTAISVHLPLILPSRMDGLNLPLIAIFNPAALQQPHIPSNPTWNTFSPYPSFWHSLIPKWSRNQRIPLSVVGSYEYRGNQRIRKCQRLIKHEWIRNVRILGSCTLSKSRTKETGNIFLVYELLQDKRTVYHQTHWILRIRMIWHRPPTKSLAVQRDLVTRLLIEFVLYIV